MADKQSRTYTIFRNPVAYCFYVLLVLLMLASWGESPGIVLQHLLVPYTVDITHGVGTLLAEAFRYVMAFAQILVFLFFALTAYANAGAARCASICGGILFVLLYFSLIVLGYILPRLH